MNKSARSIRSRPTRPERVPGESAGARLAQLRRWMHAGLQALPRESTVLALGCEEAFLASQLSDYSADVTVLDTSSAELAQLSRRFPEISFLPHDPAHPLPFARDTFDAIWCCEYLDRVFDPSATLRDMHRVLRPAGRTFVVVPDHSVVRRALSVLFRRDRQLAAASPRVRHFNRRMLVKLARGAGLLDVHTESAGRGHAATAPMLLLTGQKDPALPQLRAARRNDASETEIDLVEQLAYAGRGPTVGV